MWIATIYGFFSVVCAYEDGWEPQQQIDVTQVMIRASQREHLVALQERFPVLDIYNILNSSTADYQWRIICPKETWAECLKELALEVEYSNFKETCALKFGYYHNYVQALGKTWQIFLGLQNQ